MPHVARIYGSSDSRLRAGTAFRLREWWLARETGTVIWCELFLLASFGFLRDMLGLPGTVTYLFDAINVFLFVGIVVRGKHNDNRSRYYPHVVGLMLLYLLTTVIGGLIAGGSVLLYLWGLRNTFRFYIFFVCCVTLLGVRDIPKIISFFKGLFLVNVALCLLEYAMGYSGDFIGGSFGVQQGGNGYLNLLLVITLVIYVVEYLACKASLLKLVAILLLCCLVMAVAELKVFFLELPVIVLLAIPLSRVSWRSVLLLAVMVLGVVVGLSAIQFFFSGSGIDFFTSDAILTYMGDGGYTGTGDLSRMNAVSRITNMFFLRDPLKLLFGMGLGNCSYSSFAALTSWFYNHFSYLHYVWFSDAYVYLETGLIGLVLYEAFFVLVFVISRLKRYRDPELRMAIDCVSIVALMAMLLSVYNSSMTVESGYLAYLVLAVPFVLDKYRKA